MAGFGSAILLLDGGQRLRGRAVALIVTPVRAVLTGTHCASASAASLARLG